MRLARGESLAVTAVAGRLCVTEASDGVSVWRRGRLRDHCVAHFPPSPEGSAAASALLTAKAGAVGAPTASQSTFRPVRVVRGTAVLVVAVMVLAVGGTTAALRLGGRSHPTRTGVAAAPAAPVAAPGDDSVAAARTAGTSTVVGDGNEAEQGWVYANAASAIFVQWTRSGSTLTGSLQSAVYSDTSQTAISPATSPFTGTVAGSSVTLTFPAGFGTLSRVTGSINGASLILSLPQTDGSVAAVTFAPGTATIYNDDLAGLQGQALSKSQTQGQAAAQAAEAAGQAGVVAAASAASAGAASDQATSNQQASQAAGQALTAAFSAVNGAVIVVQDETGTMHADLSALDIDLATTSSSSAVLAEAGSAATCTEADNVVAAADTVYVDVQGLGAADQALDRDVQKMASGLAALQSADSAWTSAVDLAPGISVAVPSTKAVEQAEVAEAAQAHSAPVTAAGILATANVDDTQAHVYAASAAAAVASC